MRSKRLEIRGVIFIRLQKDAPLKSDPLDVIRFEVSLQDTLCITSDRQLWQRLSIIDFRGRLS